MFSEDFDDEDEHNMKEQIRHSSSSTRDNGFQINYDREGRVTKLDRRGEALNEER